MIFPTTVNGIPCQCKVLQYEPYLPPRVTGMGMGDCDPPEEEYFEFELLDRKGHPASWLERYLTPTVDDRLRDEYLARCQKEICPV